jgi:transposase
VDRGKAGSKHHLAVEAHGTPLAAILTGANANDVTQLLPLIDAIPPVAGKPGAPKRRPGCVLADRGYDHDRYRMALACRDIPTRIARRGTPHGSGLGVWRYVVEQTLALLHQFRRLRTRFDKRADIHEAFLALGCGLICWRRLNDGFF